MKLAQFKHEKKRFKNLIFEEIERTFGGGKCGLIILAISGGGNGPILGGIGGSRSQHGSRRRCIGQIGAAATTGILFLSFLFV